MRALPKKLSACVKQELSRLLLTDDLLRLALGTSKLLYSFPKIYIAPRALNLGLFEAGLCN